MTDNSTIYLCRADNSLLGAIEGIDPKTCRLTKNAMELWELTFDIHQYQNAENGLRQSSYYDSLHDMMKLYLDSQDEQFFFVIDEEPVRKGDACQEIKTVTAHSIECELNHVYLKNFKINCGTQDSQEYLATDPEGNAYNVDPYTRLPHTYIPLVNYEDPQLSLLHLTLQGTGWRVQEGIDPEICAVRLSFDTSDSIYAFLMKTVSPKASVLFTFDRKHRQVGMVRAADYGEDTGVFVTMRNLMNSFTVTGSSGDSIRTKLIPTGADRLGVEYVNFGQDHLVNLDYFMNTQNEYGDWRYVSSQLRDKYLDWKAYRETEQIACHGTNYTRRELYRELSKEYNQTLADISELRSRLPNDGCRIDYKTYSVEELQAAYTAYLNAQNALITLYKNEYGVSELGGAPDYLPTPATAVPIRSTPYWQDFYAYGEAILPQIREALKMYCQTDEKNPDIVKKTDNYLYEWSLYGLDELNSKKKAWSEAARLLYHECFIRSGTPQNPVEYHTPDAESYLSLSDSQRAAFASQDAFIQQLNRYLDYMALDPRENALTGTVGKGIIRQCEEAISERTETLAKLEGRLKDLETTRSALAQSVTWEHFSRNGVPVFTDQELTVLYSMLREQEYNNPHILTTNLDDARAVVDAQETLYQDAADELYRIAQPQYSFQTELENLYCLEEFHGCRKSFAIGNFIRVGLAIHEELENPQFLKLRLISITHNPLADDSISVTFSTMTRSLSGVSDLAFLLDGSSASGGSSSAGSASGHTSGGTYGSNDANVQISSNMLNALLRTDLFGAAVSDVILDSIRANKGDFNNLLSHSGLFDSLEAGQIKIRGECLFDRIRSDNYNTESGTGSNWNLADGTFVSYCKDKDHYIKNDGNTLSVKLDNFSVDENGHAKFTGDISGSNGTFNGSLNGCDGNFKGSINVNDQFVVDDKGNVTAVGTLTAANANITGKIHATNSIISESTFSGDIEADTLVVQKGGSMAGWEFSENAFYNKEEQLGCADGAYLGRQGISVGGHFIADGDGVIISNKHGFDYHYDNNLSISALQDLDLQFPEKTLPGRLINNTSTVRITLAHVNTDDKLCLGVLYCCSDSLSDSMFSQINVHKYLIDMTAHKKSDSFDTVFDAGHNRLELTIQGSEIMGYGSCEYISFCGIETYEESGYHTAEIAHITIHDNTGQTQYPGRKTGRSGFRMDTEARKIEGDLLELDGSQMTGYEDFTYCIKSRELPASSGSSSGFIPVIKPGQSQELFDDTFEIFKVNQSELFHAGLSASSSGSNLIISDGSFHRKSSSSRRYKHSIEKLSETTAVQPDLDPKRLYDLDVVSFRYNDEYLHPSDQRYGMDIPGLIAEDVYAKYPVACNLDGTGKPEMWDVNILFPAALQLIQEMHREIELLKQKINL